MPKSRWVSISTAPADGTPITARGRDWGKPGYAWHKARVRWNGNGAWVGVGDDTMQYRYLEEWLPAKETGR